MLSKNNIKYITALSMKKRRDAERLFVAEGEKLVDELLEHFQCELLVATDDYLSGKTVVRSNTIIKANAEELKKITQLKTPASVIGVFKQPEYTFEPDVLDTNLVIALDDIQDRKFRHHHTHCRLVWHQQYHLFTASLPMSIIQKPFRLQWELSPEYEHNTWNLLPTLAALQKRTFHSMERSWTGKYLH